MMSRIDRLRPAISTRASSRSERDRARAEAGGSNLPVPISPVAPARPLGQERRRVDSEFAAQLIAQDGQRHGLRAGADHMDNAHVAYNRVEWSGRYDRRARAGRRTRAAV